MQESKLSHQNNFYIKPSLLTSHIIEIIMIIARTLHLIRIHLLTDRNSELQQTKWTELQTKWTTQ